MDDEKPDSQPGHEPAPEAAPDTTSPAVPEVAAPVSAQPVLAPAPQLPVAQPPFTPAPPVPLFPDVPSFTDRGSWLVFFGIVQILLGLLVGMFVPFMMLGAFVSRLAPGGGMRPGQAISSIAVYGFLSLAMIVLGIGSIQARRWARALTLVSSWYGLIMGTLGTVLVTAVLPVAMKGAVAQMQQTGSDAPSPEVSTAVMAVMLTVFIVIMAFFLIVVPLAFVIFYSRSDVAETCRTRDPVERWTDRAPLPVLGASMVLFFGAVYILFTAVSTPIFPFFGRYLTGMPAAFCMVVVAVIDIYLAFAFYRGQVASWWIALVTLSIRVLSALITYARADVMQGYAKMGMSESQLQMMSSSPIFRGHVFLWMNVVSMVLFLSYLLWVKRYFKASDSAPAGALPVELT